MDTETSTAGQISTGNYEYLKVLKHRKALKIDCHAQNGYYSDIILTVICYFIA